MGWGGSGEGGRARGRDCLAPEVLRAHNWTESGGRGQGARSSGELGACWVFLLAGCRAALGVEHAGGGCQMSSSHRAQQPSNESQRSVCGAVGLASLRP